MEVRAPFLARAGFTIGIATLDEKDKRPRRCSTASFPSHELSQSSRVKIYFSCDHQASLSGHVKLHLELHIVRALLISTQQVNKRRNANGGVLREDDSRLKETKIG
jgi:hypothetical protein